MREAATTFFRELQISICDALEEIDGGAPFEEDTWTRKEGGGGHTRILSGGDVFESAGVNWSEVFGSLTGPLYDHLPGNGDSFHATGVSLVLHPKSPMIPTVHANFRAISRGETSWFGGGADLTPYYPYHEDVLHFHQTFKDACDRHDPAWYANFKAWCDSYFYLPHRDETRGVGGLFFDYLGLRKDQLSPRAAANCVHSPENTPTAEAAFEFQKDAGTSFINAYLPIVARRKDESWGEKERNFQLIRRGRYVEFNLLYDRGTTFGLQTGGRTESILMSLPRNVRWEYNYMPPEGSRERELWDYLHPRDWLGESTS
jgi:coproporphyrinogen III oxidase